MWLCVFVRAKFLLHLIWTCSAWFRFLHSMSAWLLNFAKTLFSWWQIFLPCCNGIFIIPTSPCSALNTVFATEAYLSGCSGMSSTEYFHSVFPSFVLTTCSRIHHLELLIVLVAVCLWGHCWQSHRIQLFCDNAQCSMLVVLRILYLPPACAKSGCNWFRRS